MRMSKRALSTIRKSTEEWMIDEIEIWRPGQMSVDPVTNVSSHSAGTKIYDGKARVRRTGGAQSANIGEGDITMMGADFLAPIEETPIPWKDDEVLVKSTDDPELEGQWFIVSNVLYGGQQAARSFTGSTDQPSRLHNEEARFS